MKSLILMISVGLLLFAATGSFAIADLTAANIPFNFIVNGKTYPPGKYRISLNDAETTVELQKAGSPAILALIDSRLATRPDSNAEVVFDVVGKDHYLSEIYIPHMDGFYFKSISAKHTHETIKVPKS